MATSVSGFTFTPPPEQPVLPSAQPLEGFTFDPVVASANGFNITQSLLDPTAGPENAVLALAPGSEVEEGFSLTPQGKQLFDEFQATRQEERAAEQEERRGTLGSRFAEAVTEPFESADRAVQEAVTSLGLAGDDPRSGLLRRASRQLSRSGIAAGGTALAAIGSAVNLLGQAAEETVGIPRDEFVEAFDIMTLFASGGATALSRGARAPRTPVTEAERAALQTGREIPSRVPLTRADVAQDVRTQSFLDEAKQGLLGEPAKARVDALEQAQDVALRQNVQEIQRAAGGRAIPLTPQEAGLGVDRASQAIKIKAGEGKRAIKDAYDTARTLDAAIEGDLVKSFGVSARSKLIDEGFDVADSPKLSRRLSEIEDIKLTDGKLSDVTVNEIETWRKRVNKSIESVKGSDPSEAQALRTLKGDYDKFTSDLLDEGLIKGNAEAITAWKKARDLRADFGKRFESDQVIKKIVNDNLTQEESVNLLFGGSQMGFKNQAGAIVRDIKKILPEQSPEFKSLKEEAILRLVKNQSDSATFSGSKFSTAVEKAMKDNPTLMKELFTKEEIVDLRKFARFAKTITEKKPGATNPSGTANKLARMIQGTGVGSNFVSRFINIAFSPIVTPISEARAAGRVEKIINFGADVNDIRSDPELFRRALAVGAGVQAEQQ